MMTGNSPLKPYLKWAGGKRQLLSEIQKHLPAQADTYVYYEPFIGAGALLFALRPKKAVINDANTQLITAYSAIKENVENLITILRWYKQQHNAEFYYHIRNMDRDAASFNAMPDIEKAARFIYLNKTCFNGLYRVNANGFFNVPQGRYNNPAICEEELLRRISVYFNDNDISILNTGFEQAVSGANGRSFIYFDPPYHHPDKKGFTAYQADGFGERDQKQLRDLVLRLTALGVKCLVSNADTEFIRGLYHYPRFEINGVRAKRRINANSAGRGNTGEVLIRNWRE